MKVSHLFEASPTDALDALPTLPAGDDYVSPAKAGLKMCDKPIYVPNVTKAMLKQAPVEEMPLDQLVTGQGYIMKSKVKHIFAHPELIDKEPLTAVKQGDVVAIIDGNHRWLAAKLLGRTKVKVQVLPGREPPKRRR